MTDIASLTMEIDSTSATAGAAALDRLDQAGQRVARSTDAVTQAQINARYESMKTSQQIGVQADAVGGLSDQAQRLLARYDPLGAQLRKLQADFALLNKEVQSGAGAGHDAAIDITYKKLNEEIAKTKALMEQASVGTKAASGAMGDLGLNTQRARRELFEIASQISRGDYGRAAGSFGTLAANSNILALALNPVAIGLVVVTGAVLGAALAFEKGRQEQSQMNNALLLTANYAGMTRGQMESLAVTMARTSALTIGASKEIVTQIVASGRYSSENVRGLSMLVDNYAKAVGESAEKVTPQLIKMFMDPAKASEILNQQYHHLSVSELQRIKTLQDTGQVQEAVTLAIQKFDAHAPVHRENLGAIEKAWIEIKKAVSSGIDAMTSFGKDSTTDQRIAEQTKKIADLKSLVDGSSATGRPQLQALIESEERLLTALREGKKFSEDKAIAQSEAAKASERQFAAQREIDKSATHQLDVLRKSLEIAKGGAAETPEQARDKQRRIFEINKEIADLQRGMGAEGRQMAEARIEAELKLREISITAATTINDAQRKTEQITQEQFERNRTNLELMRNAAQQAAIEQQSALAGATSQQKQQLDIALRRLQAEREAIEIKGTAQAGITSFAQSKAQADIINHMIDSVNNLGAADLKRLTESIAAQKLHNAEIGKTKEQVELAKQSQQDVATAKLQNQADAIAGLLEEEELNEHAREIYTAMLEQLEKLIAARKELAGLMGDAAVQQRQADQVRAQSQEFTRLWNTVEQTGKTVFAHLVGGGKDAFQAIGAALKASVIDLLYQLTLRPFIIQIGTSIASSMGLSAATSAAGSVAGSVFGNGASSLLSAAGLSSLPSMGTALGNVSGAVSTFSTLMAEGAGAMEAFSLAAAGMGPSMISLLGPIGIAVAGAAMLGLFDSGGPKPSEAWLQGGPGSYNIGMNNVEGGDPDMGQIRAINALLQDPTKFDQQKLLGMVGKTVSTGGPASTSALLNMLTEQLQGAADSAKAMQEATAAAAATLLTLQKSVTGAVDAQISASEAAAREARSMGEAFRKISTSLEDAITELRLGDLSPLTNRQKLDASGDSLSQIFASAMGGDQAALSKLPQVATDFLTASRGFNASSQAYLDDFNRVTDMLAQAAVVASGKGNQQDYMATLLEIQSEVLRDIKVELQKPSPDAVYLLEQKGILQTIGGQLGAAQDLTMQQILATFSGNAELDAIRDLTAMNNAISQNGLQALLDRATLQTDSLAAVAAASRETVDQLQKLIDYQGGGTPGSASAQAAYTEAKAISDAWRDAQLAYVQSNGGGFARAEDIASGMAQQVYYGTDPAGAASMGESYGAAFLKAYQLYKSIPGHATGGMASGLSWVGERGAELVDFTTPGRVYTAEESRAMIGSGITKADIERLVVAVERGNTLIELAAERASSDIQDQTEALSEAQKEAAREMGDVVASNASATVLR